MPVVFVLLVSIERLVYVSPHDRQHVHALNNLNFPAGNPDQAQPTWSPRGVSYVQDVMMIVRIYRLNIADVSYYIGDVLARYRRCVDQACIDD